MTVWNGQLVWSCRMDEQLKYGCNISIQPRSSCAGAPGCAGTRAQTGPRNA